MSDIVYVLTNPAMPGLVKIGKTTQNDPETRISQLYTTGVPVPFDIEFAADVEDSAKVEQALHTAFAPNRINPKREFFKIDPEQAISILRLLDLSDVKDRVSEQEIEIDKESRAAGEQLRKRRPNMNFKEMGIAEGEELHHIDSEATVTVCGPKKVLYGDEEMSLTAATRAVTDSEYDRPPALYWTYNGQLLREIYEDTYDPID